MTEENSSDQSETLFDVFSYKSWENERDSLSLCHFTTSPQKSLWTRILSSFTSGLPNFVEEKNSQNIISWKMAPSEDGSLLAVLTNSTLEIYGPLIEDGESSPLSIQNGIKAQDPFPVFRTLSWFESRLLVVTYSDGTIDIFNGFASYLYSVFPSSSSLASSSSSSMSSSFSDSYVSVSFSPYLSESSQSSETPWICLLILLSYKGTLRIFLLSLNGFQETETCSQISEFSSGLTASTFSPTSSLLLVSGPTGRRRSRKQATRVLRLVHETPIHFTFLSPIFETEIFVQSLVISPSNKLVALLLSDGSISIISFPSLLPYKHFNLESQIGFDDLPPYLMSNSRNSKRKNEFIKLEYKYHPSCLEWWSESYLIIARYSGSVSILGCDGLTSIFGSEFFSSPPLLSRRFGNQIYVLEVEDENEKYYEDETQNDENQEDEDKSYSALFQVFFDRKQRQKSNLVNSSLFPSKKIYRLISIVSTTPNDSYLRKIEKEDYGDALLLARHYHLNTDVVYESQWRKSNYSSIAISDYLSKIKNSSIVLSECSHIIPSTLEASEDLLKFGLLSVKKALCKDENNESLRELSTSFTNYLELLLTYEKLLASYRPLHIGFNPDFYRIFRSSNLCDSLIKFAYAGQWSAVSILFERHYDVISPHFSKLLNQFPESVSPSTYFHLLPTKDNSFGISNLENWYENRALTLEKETNLPDNALELLNFASSHSIPVSPKLVFDLEILHSCIYEHYKVSLNLEKMTQTLFLSEICLELLSNTFGELDKDLIGKLFLPYAHKMESLSSSSSTFYFECLANIVSLPQIPSDFILEILKEVPKERITHKIFAERILSLIPKVIMNLSDLQSILSFLLPFYPNELKFLFCRVSVNLILNSYVSESLLLQMSTAETKDHEVLSLFGKIFKEPKVREILQNKGQWLTLFEDIFKVLSLFSLRPSLSHYELLLSSLLLCENTDVVLEVSSQLTSESRAPRILETFRLTLGIPKVSKSLITSIMINASNHYFDLSSNSSDPFLRLSHSLSRPFPSTSLFRLNRAVVLLKDLQFHDFIPKDLKDSTNHETILYRVLNDDDEEGNVNYREIERIGDLTACLSESDTLSLSSYSSMSDIAYRKGEFELSYSLACLCMSQNYRGIVNLLLSLLPHYKTHKGPLFKMTSFIVLHGASKDLFRVLSLFSELKSSQEKKKNEEDITSCFQGVLSQSSWLVTLHPFYLSESETLSFSSSFGIETKSFSSPSPPLHSLYNPISFQTYRDLKRVYESFDSLTFLSFAFISSVFDIYITDGEEEKWNSNYYFFLRLYLGALREISLLESVSFSSLSLHPQTLIFELRNSPRIKKILGDYKLLSDGLYLNSLNKGINLSRWMTEDKYKEDTIIGLSLSTEAFLHDVSLLYAKSYGLNPFSVSFNYLMTLLTTDHTEKETTKGLIKDLSVSLQSMNPSGFEAELTSRVFPLLNGRNYSELLLYYSLFSSNNNNNILIYQRILCKLMSMNSSLDFKSLIVGELGVSQRSSTEKLEDYFELLSHLESLQICPRRLLVSVSEWLFEERTSMENYIQDLSSLTIQMKEEDLEEYLSSLFFYISSSSSSSEEEKEKNMIYLRNWIHNKFPSLSRDRIEIWNSHLTFSKALKDKETRRLFLESKGNLTSLVKSLKLQLLESNPFSLSPLKDILSLKNKIRRKLIWSLSTELSSCLSTELSSCLSLKYEKRVEAIYSILFESLENDEDQNDDDDENNLSSLLLHLLSVFEPKGNSVVLQGLYSKLEKTRTMTMMMRKESCELLTLHQSSSLLNGLLGRKVTSDDILDSETRFSFLNSLILKSLTFERGKDIGNCIQYWEKTAFPKDKNYTSLWKNYFGYFISVIGTEDEEYEYVFDFMSQMSLSSRELKDIINDCLIHKNIFFLIKFLLLQSSEYRTHGKELQGFLPKYLVNKENEYSGSSFHESYSSLLSRRKSD